MANKITESAAWAAVEKLKEAFKAISGQEGLPDAEQLSQLGRQLDFIAERLLRADPDLAPAQPMQELGSHLNGAHSQVTALASNHNRQHLKQAAAHMSAAIQYVMSLPLVDSAERMQQGFSDILVDAKQAADIVVDSISDRSEELENTIRRLQEQATSLEADVKSTKERTDAVVAEYQKQFSDNENTRAKRFEDQLKKVNEQSESFKARLEQDASTARDELAEKAKSLLEMMQAREAEIRALARAMGASGVSTTFQATANSNERAANLLRFLAIVLLLSMVAIIGGALWKSHTVSLETTLIRFLAAMLISIPATYLARESAHQRAEAVRSRRIEVELAALGPFIEPLEGEEKAELRKKLVETYFGRAFDKEESDGEAILLGGSLLDFVRAGKEWLKR